MASASPTRPANPKARAARPATPVRRLVFGASLIAGAALVAASAAIHLHLWATGYRNLPTIGPLFVVQGVTGLVLAVVLVASRRLAVIVAGAGYLAATIGGFLVSFWVGLFGFHDTLAAPHATTSLIVEGAGIVVLAVAAGLVLDGNRTRSLPRGVYQ